jgi:hypothetical protein
MIFWSLCAFIGFRNIEKMLLQMTSVSLQPVPTLVLWFFCKAVYESHPESKVTRAPEAGGNFLFRSWRTWHIGGILALSLFGPACLSIVGHFVQSNKFFQWRGRRALPPPPFCTGRRSFYGFYHDGGMTHRCVTTPQNSKDNFFSGVIHFPQPPECSRRTIQAEKS